MKLSSLDIRKQEFTRVVRGYDKDEVDAFLQLAANQWQELVDDLRREEEKVKELNIKMEHYQKVEEALEEALKTARDGAKQTIENAEKKAKLILEAAEARSVEVTKDAESERLGIRKDAAKYSVRQKEIVAKLRAFLMSELEILAQYESEAPVNYIKLMPAEAAELVESTPKAKPSKNQEPIPEDWEEAQAQYEAAMADDYEDEDALEGPPEKTEVAEAVEVAATVKEASSADKSGTRPPKPSEKQAAKESDVSDEIEKIRRILEDLEK